MVYNDEHRGIQIPNSIGVTSELLVLDETTIKAYLSREDLTLLLNQVGCVGIRVYNLYDIEPPLTEFDTNPGIIATGVLSTGFEIENGAYIQSHHSSSDLHLDTAQIISRSEARGIVIGGTFQVDDAFASYFSKSMINVILSDNNITGITFYNYKLQDPASPPTIMFNSALNTHVAVPTIVNADGTLPLASSQQDASGFIPHVLSDQPCPGHCAKREILPSGIEHFTVTPSVEDIASQDNSDPYLFEWH